MIAPEQLARRAFLAAPLLALPAPALASGQRQAAFVSAIAELERRHGGRLGVAVMDRASGALAAYRGSERFAFCSVYKVLATALVLARVDAGRESLARRVVFGRNALVDYSPVTALHAGASGMSMDEVCAAALTVSDNTAANLMFGSFGGPAALTAWLRRLGDGVTRVDRNEPGVNEVGPGDARDTTTPAAMLATLWRIVLGNVLSPRSRAQLIAWMTACRTGVAQLRAGVPPGWRVADKTGSGPNHVSNDVAVIWPPGGPPIIVTAFYAGSPANAAERNAVLAKVGRHAVSM